MNDFPTSFAKGGKEAQLSLVRGVASRLCENVSDIWAVEKISTSPVLHCFGDAPHFYYTYNFLRGLGKTPTLIVSPSFYRRAPYVYWISRFTRGFGPNWWSERFKLYNAAHCIIVNSNYEKKYLSLIFGREVERKTRVIHNAFVESPIYGASSAEYDSNHKYICCISHISERKNIINLIRAADRIYASTGLHTKIVGGLRFSRTDNIKRFHDALHNADHVEWLGERSSTEARKVLLNSRLHILPSLIESPGIATLEALGAQIPAVAGDFPVVREYFGGNVTYCKRSERSIFNAVLRAIESPLEPIDSEKQVWSQMEVEAKYEGLLGNY